LAENGASRRGSVPFLVGFAVETDANQMVNFARSKLAAKRADVIVANLASESFGLDRNHVTLVEDERELELPVSSKSETAQRILDFVVQTLVARGITEAV